MNLGQIPEGWSTASISEIAQGGLFVDGDWVESKDQDPKGEIRLTQLADVGEGEFRDRSNRWLRYDQADRLGVTFLQDGDLLIARMPDPLGRCCQVPKLESPAITVVDVAVLRISNPMVEPRFLMWALNSPKIREDMTDVSSGTTRVRISRKKLGGLRVPLPPLMEQIQIVEILEEQLSRLDAAVKSVQTVREKAAQFRRSLLHSAFSSGLTNFEADLTDSFKNWMEVEVGDLGAWVTGSTPSSKYVDSFGVDFPFVTPGDISQWGKLGTTARRLSHQGKTRVREVRPPSVLLVCIGTIGKVAWSDLPVATNQQINALSVDASKVDPRFISLLFASPGFQEMLWQSSSSTTVSIINKGALSKLKIRIPGLETQRQIAQFVEHALSQLEVLLSTVDLIEKKAVALRRALLQAAFTGSMTRKWRENHND